MRNEKKFVWAELAGAVALETPKAIGLDVGVEDFVWLPKSRVRQIAYDDGVRQEVLVGRRVVAFELEDWLAKKNNWPIVGPPAVGPVPARSLPPMPDPGPRTGHHPSITDESGIPF